jgi:hypothetical protein
MIEIIPSPDHVAAMRIRGTIGAEQFDTAIAEIERKLQGHEEIGVFVDLGGFEGITADAIGRDLKYAFDKMGELHRFKRVAYITDKDWIETAAKVSDSVLPQIEVRVFDTQEAEEAMAWASKLE